MITYAHSWSSCSLAIVPITPWHWAGFIAVILVLLSLDLGVFNRRPHEIRFTESLVWTAVWISLALFFSLALKRMRGDQEAEEFLTAYVIELSLSIDNLFVIALIFGWFAVPAQYRHRVLFWGVLGAVVMRGVMIGVGLALVSWLFWIFYFFGLLLVFSGVKMMLARSEVRPEKNPMLKLARKFFPVSPQFEGNHFVTRRNGRTALTPLALVLLVVETSDLVFAADSVPAVFAVTTRPFIAFTSNILAVLGLRSLYFVLEGALGYFRYLKYGLSLVLIFVGVKMLIDPHGHEPLWFQVEIPTGTALLVVAGILVAAMGLSLAVSLGPKRRSP